MSSKMKKSPSIRTKFAVVFGLMFLLSTTIPLGLTLYFTYESLKKTNRSEIEDKAAELLGEFRQGGLREIKKTIEIDNTLTYDRPFFVRVSERTDNRTIFLSTPQKWLEFNLRHFAHSAPEENGNFLLLKDPELDYDLEILTVDLSENYVLQIGTSTKIREHVISSSFNTFILILIPSIVLVLALIWYISSSMLKPISNIVEIVRNVIHTDTFRQQIPHKRNSREFDELVEHINTMFSKLDSLISNLKETQETLAHDIRTPMTRIRTRAEVAIAHPEDTEEMRRTLNSIINESDNVGSLLRIILDASEAESGLINIHEEKIDLIGLCRDAAEVYEYIGADKNITVSVDSPSSLYINADPSRIQQAIGNLLDNAVKYSLDGGHIKLTVTLDGEEVVVRVSDEGEGFENDIIEDIWKPRFRSQKLKAVSGYGLGLAIVKAVIEAHSGTVGARNRAGGGAEFYFTLPESRILSS